MVKAIWNEVVLAESDETRVVEGNHYFPPESVNWEYFATNEHHTVCPWKGTASYYDIEVDGRVNRSAAWYYPQPSSAARQIKDYVAFWGGVNIVNEDQEGESAGLMDRMRNALS
jgi:uncharacterized protein (DUF427 family)